MNRQQRRRLRAEQMLQAERPRVWIFNGTGLLQVFGCYDLPPNRWSLAPHNLAERLRDERGYRFGGTGVTALDEPVIQAISERLQSSWKESFISEYPSVAIVIAVHNCPNLLATCHDSLKRMEYPGEVRLIWVDDGSTDLETRRMLGEFRDDEVLRNETPEAYAWSVNRGFIGRTEDLFCSFNQDCEAVDSDWLTKLVGWMKTEPSCGICGPLLVYRDDKVQHAGIEIKGDLTAPHLHKGWGSSDPGIRNPRKVDAITGAVLLTSRWLWQELGGLDDRYPFGHEDLDFCLRALLEQEAETWCAPVTKVVHLDNGVRNSDPETQARTQKWSAEGEERFRNRWGEFILRRMYGEVAFLLPSNIVANDRTKFIWRLVNHFQVCGQRTVIYTYDGIPPENPEIMILFDTKPIKDLNQADTVVVTGWETAKISSRIPAKRKFYLGNPDAEALSKYLGAASDLRDYQVIPYGIGFPEYTKMILGGQG